VTLNIYPFSDEYERLTRLAYALDEIGADAFIVSDMGLLRELKEMKLKAALHISTQANTTSWQTVLAYKELGAARVNLARELSLAQITEIQRHTAGQIETEVFIHGAACLSYSGRCAISDYLTGARANRGECKHPCRWKYFLVEEERPGKFMPVFEDERGLYLFNSKELALWEYVPALMEAGVRSFKIEGRMKSIHYVAAAVSFYRQVLDGKRFTQEEAMAILSRVPNRGYSQGFMKGGITPEDYTVEKSVSEADSVFVGNICTAGPDGAVIQVRNRIEAGDRLETLQPDGNIGAVTLPRPLETTEGEYLDVANNGRFIKLPTALPEYTILRRLTKKLATN
jgi:putative protease